MAKVIAGMAMSLDGFMQDREGSVAALYPDLNALIETDTMRESIENTGAVVMGRNAYAMAEDPDWFAGNYEYQTPIFVLTHEAPKKHPKESEELTFTFITDGVEGAIKQAKQAAGNKVVQVIGGASTFQQCMRAGLVDELHILVMPILLGEGLKQFENINADQIHLEMIKVEEIPGGGILVKYTVRR